MAHGNSQQKYCKQRVAQTAVVDLVIEYCMLWGDVMQSQSYAQAGDRKPLSACAYWVCACRIDFVASRVAKRHMRRSRERRVTTCYYHCMALIDLIVSHTTHMTSYDHQNVISRYRICASTTSMTMVQFRHFTCLFSDRVRRFGSSTKRRHWCRHGAITPLISSPTRRDRALLPS